MTYALAKELYERSTDTNSHTRPEQELESVSMDLPYSVNSLLEAFSNAEDVDWLKESGGDMGKTFAKWTTNLISVNFG